MFFCGNEIPLSGEPPVPPSPGSNRRRKSVTSHTGNASVTPDRTIPRNGRDAGRRILGGRGRRRARRARCLRPAQRRRMAPEGQNRGLEGDLGESSQRLANIHFSPLLTRLTPPLQSAIAGSSRVHQAMEERQGLRHLLLLLAHDPRGAKRRALPDARAQREHRV